VREVAPEREALGFLCGFVDENPEHVLVGDEEIKRSVPVFVLRAVAAALASPPSAHDMREAELDAAARALYKAYEETTDQHVCDIWEWAVSHPDQEVQRSCAQTVEEMREWARKVLTAAALASSPMDAVKAAVEAEREACAKVVDDEITRIFNQTTDGRGSNVARRIRDMIRARAGGGE